MKGLKGFQKGHGSFWTPESIARLTANHARHWLGKTRPDITAKRKGVPHLNQRGENNGNWKGGVTGNRKREMGRIEYITWRSHVFQRDDYTCQACKTRGGDLEADHLLPYALYPDIRLEILNGQTLCRPCHLKTPTFGSKAYEY